MSKNYDELRAQREQKDRVFVIGGQEFRFRAAIPAEQYSLYLETMDQMGDGRWPKGSFAVLNATILSLLQPEYHDAWESLLADGRDHPVSFDDMVKIIDDSVAVLSGRPTAPPSPSGSTGGSGGTTSTGDSGSQEVKQEPPPSTSGAS